MDNEELHQIAKDAVKRKRYKQAIGYFNQILKKDPEDVEARKCLRAIHKSTGGAGKIAAKMQGVPLKTKVSMHSVKKNYDEGIICCEELLRLDPDDSWALQKEAEFAVAKEYVKTACYCYEILAEINPDNVKIVSECAEYLSNNKVYDKADEMMARLVKSHPNDMDLSNLQSLIAAKKTQHAFDKAEHTVDLIDKDKAALLEQESQEIKTADDLERAIDRAKKRIEEDPSSARSQEGLGDLLARKKLFKEAIDSYKAAIELDPNNEETKSKVGNMRIELLTSQLVRIKKKLETSEGAEKQDLQTKYKKGLAQLNQMKLNEFQRRLKVNPNDPKTRFEMGKLLYDAQKIDEAIQQFQRSATDARLSFQSLMFLGYSFKKKKLYDLAIKQFISAGKRQSAKAADRMNVKYEVALCCDAQGNYQEALDHFKQILEKDFGFKDVAQRVEQLESRLKE